MILCILPRIRLSLINQVEVQLRLHCFDNFRALRADLKLNKKGRSFAASDKGRRSWVVAVGDLEVFLVGFDYSFRPFPT